MKYEIRNVQVCCSDDMSREECEKYIEIIEKKKKRKLATLDVLIDGEDVDLDFSYAVVPFERIRRITGYLTGDVSSWNDAKTAELADRVKHGLGIDKI